MKPTSITAMFILLMLSSFSLQAIAISSIQTIAKAAPKSSSAYIPETKTSNITNTALTVNSFTQRIQFDWSQNGLFQTSTMVNGMNSDNKLCGKSCNIINLSVAPSFKYGSIRLQVIDNVTVKNKNDIHCMVNLDIPFEIQYGYLVTHLHTYKLSWVSTNSLPCPDNSFILKVDGDPTERTGYTVKLSTSKLPNEQG